MTPSCRSPFARAARQPGTRARLFAAALLVLSLAAGCGSGSSGAADAAGNDADAGALDAGSPEPRLLALSRDGQVASLEVTAPWSVHASRDLGAAVHSARCRGNLCVVVHPSPTDAITVLAASDLSVMATINLEPGSDPRDVALVDDRTAVVSQFGRAALLEVDLPTRGQTPIDLAALADGDGLPEPQRLAHCGRRVFAQLRRIDHETGAPAAMPAVLAVIDLDRPSSDRIVDADPATPGLQGIALHDRPDFDMPTDCAAGVLYVAEPRLLMQGGGGYERVDLHALTAAEFPIATGAQVGGFEVLGPTQHWLITHTDTGPGASSHLNLFTDGTTPDTYNTFASEHVDDLAWDRASDLLFFPDPCSPSSWAQCQGGLHVFNAHTGAPAAATAVDVGFAPIEVVIAR